MTDPHHRRLFRRMLGGLVVASVIVVVAVARYGRATVLLLRLAAAGAPGGANSALAFFENDVAVESVEIPTEVSIRRVAGGAPGCLHARIYRPAFEAGSWRSCGLRPRGVVLAHGVHYLGIDEPRLVALAHALAAAGAVVLTPELAPLADYHVDDEGNLEAIRVAVHHLARRSELVRDGGVGLMGVSFAGGLSLRVASEPSMRGELEFVASVGGHHDMRRVARFFARDVVETPEGERPAKAHDYGVAVLVYGAAERFVAAGDAPQLRTAVRAFLHASYPAADQAALSLSPEGRALFARIAHRDTAALGPKVLDSLPALAATMAASSPVGRVASIRVPIFLLHGAHDDVVPSSESRWVAREAGEAGVQARVLVTSKIGHAELGDEGGVTEDFRLIGFMAALLDG